MTPTTVVGLHLDEVQPYRVVLNGASPIEWSPGLADLAPAPGTPVVSGPVGVEVAFDPADPVAVYVWLRGHTEVHRVEGPDLTPGTEQTVPGRIH